MKTPKKRLWNIIVINPKQIQLFWTLLSGLFPKLILKFAPKFAQIDFEFIQASCSDPHKMFRILMFCSKFSSTSTLYSSLAVSRGCMMAHFDTQILHFFQTSLSISMGLHVACISILRNFWSWLKTLTTKPSKLLQKCQSKAAKEIIRKRLSPTKRSRPEETAKPPNQSTKLTKGQRELKKEPRQTNKLHRKTTWIRRQSPPKNKTKNVTMLNSRSAFWYKEKNFPSGIFLQDLTILTLMALAKMTN